MALINKISLKHGYTLTIEKDDCVSLKIDRADDEPLEVDGKNGNLMLASDMEAWFDEEPCEMTLDEIRESTRDWLKDWGVDEDVADAIIYDLTPWFEDYAISVKESVEKKVAYLKDLIDARYSNIAVLCRDIEAQREDIRTKEGLIKRLTDRVIALDKDITELKCQMQSLEAELPYL